MRHVLSLLCLLAVPALFSSAAEPRRDVYGDALPPGAILRLGTTRLRHGSHVKALLYSHDGKWLVSAGWDKTVSVWHASTGEAIRHFTDLEWPGALALSPDGKLLAAGDSSGKYAVCVWEMANGKLLARLEGGTLPITTLAFSPDGKALASGSWDGNVRVWEMATQRTTAVLECSKDGVNSIAYTPDGKTLAVASRLKRAANPASERGICLWNIAEGKIVQRLGEHRSDVLQIAITPDGKTLVSLCLDSRLRSWDLTTGKSVREWTTNEHRFALTAQGKQLICCDDKRGLCTWDIATGKRLRHFADMPDRLYAVAVDPAGKTLAYCNDNFHAIRLFDLETGKERDPVAGHRSRVVGLGLTPDGRTWATASQDGTLRFWDAATGKLKTTCVSSGRYTSSLSIAPDGETVALGGNNGCVSRWQIPSGKKLTEFPLHTDWAFAVTFAPDGKHLLSGSHDGVIRLTEAETGKEVKQFQAHTNSINNIALTRDGSLMVSAGNDGTIRLWDCEKWRPNGEPIPSKIYLASVALSPDGRLLAGAYDDRVRLWDVVTRREIIDAPGNLRHMRRLAFSPDGRLLVTAGDRGSVHVWEVASGQERACFEGHREAVYAVMFTPDGRRIASAGDDTTALIWDLTADPLAKAAPTKEELETAWKALKEGNGKTAHVAVWTLIAAGRATPALLEERMKPGKPIAPERLKRLVIDLDSESFETRERASEELEGVVDQVQPDLRKMLKETQSVEVRRRLEQALELANGAKPTAEMLRQLRAVEVLEMIGSPEAIALLKKLAAGVTDARLTRDAKAGLRRLEQR